MKKRILSLQSLKYHLNYNTKNGRFVWKIPTSNRVRVGENAGCKSHTTGYIFVGIMGDSIPAHRLAWFYMTGHWPKSQIDHINNNRMDNSWKNLREATNSQNKHNAGKHRDNKSGYVGVAWEKNIAKWRAQIMVKGKRLHLGVFSNKENAAKAYDAAALRFHGKFAKLNFKEKSHRQA